jgi:hypothetical protein
MVLRRLVSFISFIAIIPSESFTSILNRYNIRTIESCTNRFHQVHDDPNVEFSLPIWASGLMQPPDKVILDALYLGDDDFVSVELENDSDIPQEFCVDVVYQDPTSSPKYFVDPRMGVIEPNGGQTILSVMPILDEDNQLSSKSYASSNHCDAWLVVVTPNDRWYYKLEREEV